MDDTLPGQGRSFVHRRAVVQATGRGVTEEDSRTEDGRGHSGHPHGRLAGGR